MTETVTVKQYAEQHEVTTRTVERWLGAGLLPGAVRIDRGRNRGWQIPADLVPPKVTTAPAAQTGAAPGRDVAPVAPVGNAPALPMLPQGVSLSGMLDQLPAMIPLEVAALLLGISEHTIRRRRGELGAKRWGPNGALLVPARTVRDYAGL